MLVAAVSKAVNYLPCLGRTAVEEPVGITGDLNKARVYIEYPGQVKPLVFLCRQGRPLYSESLDESAASLVRFPSQEG